MRFAFSAVDRFQTLGLIEVNLRPILALQVVPGGRHTILISMGVGTKKILVWISKDLRGAKWAGASSLPKKLCGKIGVGGRHRPGGGIAQGGGIAKKKHKNNGPPLQFTTVGILIAISLFLQPYRATFSFQRYIYPHSQAEVLRPCLQFIGSSDVSSMTLITQ